MAKGGVLALLLLAAGTVASAQQQFSNSAHLIVRKDITADDCDVAGVASQCVVAGKDAVVHYTIFNVGNSAAYEIALTDESLDEAFTMGAPVSFTFETIAAGENETVSTTVTPKESGALGVGSAQVRYKPTAEGPTQTGSSTKPQAFHAETERQNRKRTTYHIMEWVIFLALSLLPIAVPGMTWSQTEFIEEKIKEKAEREAKSQ